MCFDLMHLLRHEFRESIFRTPIEQAYAMICKFFNGNYKKLNFLLTLDNELHHNISFYIYLLLIPMTRL